MQKILILCISLTLLSACKKEENHDPFDSSNIYGKWQKVDYRINGISKPISEETSIVEFFENGTQLYYNSSGLPQYEQKVILKDGIVSYPKSNSKHEYKIEDGKLILTVVCDEKPCKKEETFLKKIGSPREHSNASCQYDSSIYGKWEVIDGINAPFQISISKSHIAFYKEDGQLNYCKKIHLKDHYFYIDGKDEDLHHYRYDIYDCKLALTMFSYDAFHPFFYKKIGSAQELSGSCQ